MWASISLMGTWGEWNAGYEGKNAVADLLVVRGRISNAFTGHSGWVYAALAAIMSIGVAGLVAWQSAREALRVRYPRRVLVVQWLPAAWGVVVGLAALAGEAGVLPELVARSMVMAAMALATAAILLTTIYLVWRNIAERVLTTPYVVGAVVILSAFLAGYATWLGATGAPEDGAHWTFLALLSWPVLLLMMGGAIAPWALGRVRHT
jgi:hypothetical protein